ncbi:hypothetical protein ES703_96409 [subsurface metagenome]
MRKIKKILMILAVLALTFMLSGCFFSKQQIVIDPEGRADITISFWFETGIGGSETEGSIAMSQLLFAFQEIQTYEMITEIKKETEDMFADKYLVYTFKKQNVDIAANRYVNFNKKDDGSYYFEAKIPKALTEKVEESNNKKIVTISVNLPQEIEMANSLHYEGKSVEWELRTNDFTTDIILRAFTKTP